MNFLDTLHLLRDWKRLPAYRAEPRVDFIVAGALPEILMCRYNQEIAVIIPELPLRIGSIVPNRGPKEKHEDRSYKIDFYVLLRSGKHLFVEFKTDSRSRNAKQDMYLKMAQEAQMQCVLEGIIRLSKVTAPRYRKKYQYLLEMLSANRLIEENRSGFRSKNLKCKGIEVIFIQPSARHKSEIGFREVAKVMQDSDDPVYSAFAKCLENWAED